MPQLWWKESSPWEDWLVTWQVFRISTGFLKVSFRWYFPHAVSFWNMIPGSLLTRSTPKSTAQRTFTFLTRRFNVVLSLRTTRVRVPLAQNPSPLQYPTLCVGYWSGEAASLVTMKWNFSAASMTSSMLGSGIAGMGNCVSISFTTRQSKMSREEIWFCFGTRVQLSAATAKRLFQ